MKPTTAEELRRLAESTRAMCSDDDRDSILSALALERWAIQIEQKRNFWSRKKAREARKGGAK